MRSLMTPAATNAVPNLPPTGVQVTIPAALNRPSHTLYSITMSVQPTKQEWTVNRRYSQFLQLRKDLIAALEQGATTGCCSQCGSVALALRKFPFPHKTWIRTNRIVRRRVRVLEELLQLLVSRVFNDLPKCRICGDQVKKMVRPFLIRGARPMGDGSTVAQIQGSLSLQSYAIVQHAPSPSSPRSRSRPRSPSSSSPSSSKETSAYQYHDHQQHHADKQDPAMSVRSKTENSSCSSQTRTDSDPALDAMGHPNASPTHSTDSDLYGNDYGEEVCEDEAVPLHEAMKQVVLADGRKSTYQEVATRLSSMWSAYDLDETLRAESELDIRLSAAFEDSDNDSDSDSDSDRDHDRHSDGGNVDKGRQQQQPVPSQSRSSPRASYGVTF